VTIFSFKQGIVGDNFSNEALLVEIYVGAAFHNLWGIFGWNICWSSIS